MKKMLLQMTSVSLQPVPSLVIFVLNDCFVGATKNSFSCGCANKKIVLRTKYKHYFFYNRQKKNLIFEGKLDEENQSIKYCDTSLLLRKRANV
jgi:hypothetical protein